MRFKLLKAFFTGLFLIASGLHHSQADTMNESPVLHAPVISPKEAVHLAENYLAQATHLDKSKFRLSSVMFEYFTNTPAPPGKISMGWALSFDCVPVRLDCEYFVQISNSKNPKIVVYPPR